MASFFDKILGKVKGFMEKSATASNEDLSFEQILATLSDEEMIKMIETSERKPPNERVIIGKDTAHPKLDRKKLSADEQKLNLAFWAKAVRAHVGWDSFGEDNQKNFKEAVEKIYKEINARRNQKDFMMMVAKKTCSYVQDRHFQLSTGNDGMNGGGKKEKRDVGKNLAKKRKKPKGFKVIGQRPEKPKKRKEIYWQIGTMKGKEGEDILIVSIPRLPQSPEEGSAKEWQDFITTFKEFYNENKANLDKGRIILDVRGNKGGEDNPIDYLAKLTYGNPVNTFKHCEINDTPLGNFFLHKHGAYKPASLKRDGLTPEKLVQRQHFSNQPQLLFDETKNYYPFNEDIGYKGRIDILIDRDVASSGESAVTSFYHHPNVRIIGDNTAGMQQYTQGNITLPCDYAVRVACSKLTYWDKEGENIECVGHKPDIRCKDGEDALTKALNMDIDEGRGDYELKKGLRFRKLDVLPEKRTVVKDYPNFDPTTPDQRKAYHAEFIDPALRKLEDKNRLEEIKRLEQKRDMLEDKIHHLTPKEKENFTLQKLDSVRARLPKNDSEPKNASITNLKENADSSQMRRLPPDTTNGL